METELVEGPVQFAEQHLGLKLPVVSRVAMRRLADPLGGRVGLQHSRFSVQEARKFEIAAALWHLYTRPNDDVVISVSNQSHKEAWLLDCALILRERAGVIVQRDFALYGGNLITRFLGTGKLLWNVARGKDRQVVGEIHGDRPLLIVAGIDAFPTSQVELYQRFAPPGFVVATSYAAH